MNLILFDQPDIFTSLLPLTYTRPVAMMRVGILTIAEKWKKYLNLPISFLTTDYLQEKFGLAINQENLLINGALCPDTGVLDAIDNLNTGDALYQNDVLLAYKTSENGVRQFINLHKSKEVRVVEHVAQVTIIRHTWDIFRNNASQIKADFQLLTHGRTSADIKDTHVRTYNDQQIFLEKGAEVKAAVLNAENGPIYLGVNSQVQEGALIRGSFALGEDSIVNMGGKVRGDSSVGPCCKVGGEVSNSVLFGYSNKSHDGFIGNSVLGEWCNLGADTNTSNLKNNYLPVKVWNYTTEGFYDTGLQFCGLVMGDHSKCGINTMLNTGTVIGVSANIFGAGFPRTFVPSFAWGGAHGYSTFKVNKAIETAELVMARRNLQLSDQDKNILNYVYEASAKYRIWEKK
ncbi:MAG: GlmU family protein [Cyclobacteriaceae bacterium]